MSYLLLGALASALAVAVDLLVLRTNLLRRKAFWTAYAIIVGFQLVVNGLLTGLRIVRYDAGQIIGVRIAYAPVEDLVFGFAMVMVTLSLWVWLGRRGVQPTRRAGR